MARLILVKRPVEIKAVIRDPLLPNSKLVHMRPDPAIELPLAHAAVGRRIAVPEQAGLDPGAAAHGKRTDSATALPRSG
jgi:hypothetical protein